MYDGRMHAQRFVQIRTTSTNDIIYEVKRQGIAGITEKQKTSSAEKNIEEDAISIQEKEHEKDTSTPPNTKEAENNEHKQVQKPKDPLRMFGYSTPSTLKAAQISAIQMVENSIPQLCALDAQMAEVEIKIRRARKQRSKAEEREVKEKERNNVEAGAVAVGV